MKLTELLKDVNFKSNQCSLNVEVLDICLNSKEVISGSLFFARKGHNQNGEDYIKEAFLNGAVAVITENEKLLEIYSNKLVIVVKDISFAINKIAYKFFKPNKKRVKVLGVVGTNGKTTTIHILRSILSKAGYNCGIIGTLGIEYANKVIEPSLTTPDSIELYKNLMNMANENVDYCIMEVSAHAIEQKRVDLIKFEGLIFTNCTHDHLDYFKTFENYKNVKKSIFNKRHTKIAVINVDDKVGLEIMKESDAKIFSYGIYSPCDVFAIDIKNSAKNVKFLMNLFDNLLAVSFKMMGEFNVLNCLGASTLLYALNIDEKYILEGLLSLDGVKGRMEFIESYNGANIYVDYAHTPDGLLNTLVNLRKTTKNQLILVFGCGGNRDKDKRKIMGEIAGKNADFTVITNDNPRYEEAYKIILDIESGILNTTSNYIKIESRYLATGYAIKMLKKGDTLVVCGKGGEDKQEIMGERISYSDKEVIKDIIAKLYLCGEIIWKLFY